MSWRHKKQIYFRFDFFMELRWHHPVMMILSSSTKEESIISIQSIPSPTCIGLRGLIPTEYSYFLALGTKRINWRYCFTGDETTWYRFISVETIKGVEYRYPALGLEGPNNVLWALTHCGVKGTLYCTWQSSDLNKALKKATGNTAQPLFKDLYCMQQLLNNSQ